MNSTGNELHIPGMEEIHIQVIRSKRRTLALQVKGSKQIIVRAPLRLSDKKIVEFILQHEDWIKKTMETVVDRKKIDAPKLQELSTKEREEIKQLFNQRVAWYCGKMDVAVGKITIRSQKTRWGSCSSKGNVNFNYLLAYLPRELLDYVVVHELTHRIHMDHSEQFWQMVEKYDPDYKEHRKRLKEYTTE